MQNSDQKKCLQKASKNSLRGGAVHYVKPFL